MINNTEDLGIDLNNFSIEEEIKKFQGANARGWTVAVRLYTEPKVVNGIFRPDIVHDEQQYRSCVGLVVAKSKAAYLDPRYEQTGEWCNLGDWVVFARHAGYKVNYKKLPIFILKEDAIDLVIDDPRDIERV
jgi:co-chaperonin GroES (HSP10)